MKVKEKEIRDIKTILKEQNNGEEYIDIDLYWNYDDRLTEGQIEEEFEELVRSGLTDEQFNEWVLGWIDFDYIMDIASDWDIETKKDELEQLKKRYNLK